MPAFLSHSSKDKDFVQSVARALNPLDYEFDEKTFEYTLNVRAIRQALARSDVFVAFLSKNSVASTFVAEEQRQALEALGKGTLKKVVVFALDETSYKSFFARLAARNKCSAEDFQSESRCASHRGLARRSGHR